MSDLSRWELRGPVRTARTQWAQWNPEGEDWWPLKTRFVVTFRADGRLSEIEHHNSDGSVPREVWLYDDAGRLIEHQSWSNEVLARRVLHTYDVGGRLASVGAVDAEGKRHEIERYEYDENGRKTKITFLTNGVAASLGSSGRSMYGVGDSGAAYSAPGATTSTTVYDDRDRSLEVIYRDANDALVSRVVLSRDQAGRVLSERMEFAGAQAMLGPTFDGDVPTDERDSLMELLETVFQDHTFYLTTFSYDDLGHRVQTDRQMGALSEERTAARYDDFGNVVEETTSAVHREVRMDDGLVKAEKVSSRVHHARRAYQYDTHGNWTERIISQRLEPNEEEQHSNIERRTISYYEGI